MTTETLTDLPWYEKLSIRSVLSRSIFDRLPLTLGIGFGIGLMSAMVAGLYPAMADTLASFELPDAMDFFLAGSDTGTPAGWLTVEVFSLMAPLAVVALGIIDGARSFAGEEEARSIGLLAANPLSRTRILTDKSMAILAHIVLASFLTGLFLWAGVTAFGLDLAAGNLWAAILHLSFLGAMFAGATVLASTFTGRRVMSMLVVAGIAGVCYVVASFLPLSENLGDLAKISPWHYYFSTNPLENGVDWGGIAVMAGIAAALFVLAAVVFTKRDLPG